MWLFDLTYFTWEAYPAWLCIPALFAPQPRKTDMTDFQTPAIEEIDMSAFQNMFSKIANTITAASALAIQVAELTRQVESYRVEVEALKSEVAKAREHNAWLDEQISGLREARDRAYNEAHEFERQLIASKTAHEATQRELNDERSTSERHWNALQEERDRNAQLREENNNYRARLDQLERELDETRNSLQNAAEARDYWNNRWNTTEDVRVKTQNDLDNSYVETQHLREAVARLDEDKAFLQADLADREGEVRDLKAALEATKNDMQARIDVLEQSVMDHEAGAKEIASVINAISDAIALVKKEPEQPAEFPLPASNVIGF